MHRIHIAIWIKLKDDKIVLNFHAMKNVKTATVTREF